MPYADDDVIYRSLDGLDEQGRQLYTYTSFPGRSASQARAFGRVQQSLIFGLSYGMSFQTAPWIVPTISGRSFVTYIGNYAARYLVNGVTWTFDSTGIVIGMDAIYWNPVGGSGPNNWLAVSPTTGTLPAIPSTYQLNLGNLIGTIADVNA